MSVNNSDDEEERTNPFDQDNDEFTMMSESGTEYVNEWGW